MRQIGTIPDETSARLFADHLYGLGIETDVEPGDDGDFAIWVHDEDQIPRATEELAAYTSNPTDKRFAESAQKGREAWKKAAEEAKTQKSRPVDLRTAPRQDPADTLPLFTFALIGISVFVFFLQTGGTAEPGATERLLQISAQPDAWFPEILRGEIWRLLTPMFLHFGILHIVLNMMWTWDLGGILERVHGTLTFATMVLVFSLGGNLLQYLLAGPRFGGMSGVVFGLLGFMWMKTVWDPRVPYQLPMFTVWLMGAFFIVCWTGLFGPIANWGHTGGLVAGCAWGALSSPRFRKKISIG